MLDDFLKKRNKALATLDMKYAREMRPDATDDETRLVAMHKARYEVTSLDPSLRHESENYLRRHGYHRMGGLPLLPPGELPDFNH